MKDGPKLHVPGDMDWIIDLRLGDGTVRRMGSVPSLEKPEAIRRAVELCYRNWASNRGLARNPMPYAEHVRTTKVLKARRRCEA